MNNQDRELLKMAELIMVEDILKEAINDINNGEAPNGLEYALKLIVNLKSRY